ncbi:MAG TPA: family 1 glycosylhydrolase, partial [Anaerolineaceae bacterium]|nr:family 1 glycosylhydrolase [Anaerolineaceae bacterium]
MSTPLELWAGIECTLNRVQNTWFDQLAMSGHLTRKTDLDRIAGLGIRTLRFPIRWEQVAPHGLDQADWLWVDERLARLRELGIRPIAGLLHHGSGPPHTSLIDPAFPAQFAAYARAVAERYPWLDAYTPINEPLTTARFSCLYGFWYPHARSAAAFSQALTLQIEATRQAMEAIRTVNPAAQLVQTEDIGKTYSTPRIEYQAEFDNLRRWLTFDLLTGQLDLDGPLARFMTHYGVDRARLESFCEQPSPPDVIGLNYYITSERFLDERLDLYPEGLRGGNGRHAYADVEAVRVCAGGTAGFEGLLQETWHRYHRPLAITEVQLGSTPEQRLRWWMEAWQSADRLRHSGVDVRAVTAWALLGSFNWHNLVTADTGSYEVGVFDLRSPAPRPTILAKAIRALAEHGAYDHPVLDEPGWWRQPARLAYPAFRPAGHSAPAVEQPVLHSNEKPRRKLLVTGMTGTLGSAFLRVCEWRGIPAAGVTRRELDLTDPATVHEAMDHWQPWAVINAAGFVHVDAAEAETAVCFDVNTAGPQRLAEICA